MAFALWYSDGLTNVATESAVASQERRVELFLARLEVSALAYSPQPSILLQRNDRQNGVNWGVAASQDNKPSAGGMTTMWAKLDDKVLASVTVESPWAGKASLRSSYGIMISSPACRLSSAFISQPCRSEVLCIDNLGAAASS